MAATSSLYGGSGGVNDIYTDSTATVGTGSVVAGESLKLDSTGQLLPLTYQKIANVERSSTDINTPTNNYYNASTSAQYGNPVLPDGRSIYFLQYSGGDAHCVLLEKDGKTRAGTSYTLLDQSGNTSGNQFVVWQVGETASVYMIGIAYRSYYNNYTYIYQKLFIVTVSKTSNTLNNYAMPTSYYTNAVYSSYSNWEQRLIDHRDVNSWQTCRSDDIHLILAPYTSDLNYRATAFAVQSNGNFYSSGGTDYEDLAHVTPLSAIDIVKIDDAAGIFLVMHETASGTQTLTKLVVGSDASITASTVATINSSYSGMHSNLNRTYTNMVGHGTGSNNLCFFDNYSDTGSQKKIDFQPCTYNSSTDALTWGTYAELDTPTVNGTQVEMYSTYRKQRRSRWTYASASKKIFFADITNDKGPGLVLDTQNSTLKAANLLPELSSTSITAVLTASKDGTELIMLNENPSTVPYLSVLYPFGIDTGSLVTTSAAAVAREAGVIGETINVSLIDGITSSSDLPTTHYLKKNDLFFPYTTFVDGVAVAGGGAASVIKSIQRGLALVNASAGTEVTFNAVDLDKTSINLSGGTNYNNAIGVSPWIDTITTTSMKIRTSNYSSSTGYVYWEVTEYV